MHQLTNGRHATNVRHLETLDFKYSAISTAQDANYALSASMYETKFKNIKTVPDCPITSPGHRLRKEPSLQTIKNTVKICADIYDISRIALKIS